MKLPIILKPEDPFSSALRAFGKGGILAYPTETFYGLGVDPFNEKAVERLFSLKGRPPEKPISIIIKDRKMLSSMVEEIPPAARGLIKKFWPGPLTIIFRAKNIPELLTAKTGKIAVRMSSSPAAQRLVSEANSPITATSANPSEKPPAKTAREVLDYFDGRIDILIDGGELGGRLGSTIIDVTENRIVFVREGEIPKEEILAGLPPPFPPP